MSLTTPEIISGAALLLAILSAVWQRFGVIMDIKKDQANMALNFQKEITTYKIQCETNITAVKDSLTTNITNVKDGLMKHISTEVNALYGQLDSLSGKLVLIDNRMTKQEMKMDLFWGAVQDTVKDMLKQPIHLRKDTLLDKFPDLKYEELCELKEMLIEEKKQLLPEKKLTPGKKVYLISLVLMLAGIDSRLIDMEIKC